MKNNIQLAEGNITIRCNVKSIEKGMNRKTAQETKRFSITNKNSHLSAKQKLVVQSFVEKVEKGGNINLGEILIESGYSPNTAKTPQKVFGRTAVKGEIAKRGIDPESLKIVHTDLLNAKKIEKYTFSILVPPEEIIEIIETEMHARHISHIDRPRRGEREYQFIVPNEKVQIRALEMGYKLFPPVPQQDPKMQEKFSQKRVDKLNDLAKNLKLKKPLGI